ncbi:guanylate kinase, partial [Butyricicoccus sp. 1XD8-22]
TESEEIIKQRIATAKEELEMMSLYDYVVENDEIQKACDKINAIIVAEHCRRERVEKRYLSMLRGE